MLPGRLQRGVKNTGEIQGFSPFLLRDKRPKGLVEFLFIMPCAEAQGYLNFIDLAKVDHIELYVTP
ncbi:MAG: hypothetical protein DWQ02_28010 [Bacteroidetes bacterium]|nr:MAG: hypothetical protein DWQ02_28010 [Bacteroidota bacterium]